MDKSKLKQLGEIFLKNPLTRLFEPNSNNHPEIIYKFRNWSDTHHKDLLIKNALFMSSPSGLNDPFDTRIFENHLKFLNTDEKKEEYVKNSLEKNKDILIEKGIPIEKAKTTLENRIENTLKYQVRAEVIGIKIYDDHLGITCFSEKWNSILMWSHYAENHKGISIGFDEKALRYSQLFGKIRRVNYSTEYPELNPINKNKKSDEIKFFHKSIDWEYEKEIRAINIYDDKIPSIKDRIITLEDKHIKEIIIGLKTPQKDKKEIINIARNKGIEIYQCYKSDFEFKIDRYKI